MEIWTVLIVCLSIMFSFVMFHVATGFIRVGMNDIDEEGVYVWEDGSPVTHLRWEESEPNNLNDEDCMTIRQVDGAYNDYACESEDSYFICEAEYDKL